MKYFSEEALDALASGKAMVAGAAKLAFAQEWRFWSGRGPRMLAGEEYTGIGAAALIVPIAHSIGAAASAVNLVLFNLEPDVAHSIENEDYYQRPVTIWRLIHDENGIEALDEAVFLRGRCDVAPISETIGGVATLTLVIEGPKLDLQRRGARTRSNADQRVLGGPSDGSFKHAGTAAKQTLYWGQKPSTVR